MLHIIVFICTGLAVVASLVISIIALNNSSAPSGPVGPIGPVGPEGPTGPAGAAILPKTVSSDVLTNIPRWDDPVRLYMRPSDGSDPTSAYYCSGSQGESCDFDRLIPPGYLVATGTPAGKTPMPNPNPSPANACRYQAPSPGSGPWMNCPHSYSQCLDSKGKLVTPSSPDGNCSLDAANWGGALYLGKSSWD